MFRYIYIEITNACNFSCPFCPTSSLKQNDYMNINQFKIIIDKIKKYTKSVYFHVKGEPLLHKDLNEFLNICAESNINVCITTNGVLLNKKSEILISNNNIKKINVSLQSLVNLDEEEQNQYLSNLEHFLIKKDVLNKKLGVNLRIWNDKIKNDNLNKKIEKILNKIKINNLSNVRISYADEFDWPSMDNEPIYKEGKCLGGITHLGILSNGDVILCCLDHLGHTKLGNIFENDLEEIISSQKFQNIKQGWNSNFAVEELCKRCNYKDRFKKNMEVKS